MAITIRPSWFVRSTRVYRAWCDITVCSECGQTAKYEDQHPANPCMSCGNKPVTVKVGRWINTTPRWKFWGNEGYWEVKT